MADDWSQFPVADDAPADPWAAFPVVGKGKPRKAKTGKGEILAGTVLGKVSATDGDTVRADQGKIRIAGIDAPERQQVGWDRAGAAVPIGAQSSDALANFLGRGFAISGSPVGLSYGRTAAPIGVEGIDAGNSQVRLGQALAAPEYLKTDTERAELYQQSERLARLNGLGMHDTFTPTPAEFRIDPKYVPDRATIAQFWDTPTPLDGFRPEIEQRYLHVLANGTADDILAFVKAQGTDMREKELRQWVQWRDDERKAGRNPGVEAIYERGPEALIDAGDGVGGAVVRKGAAGFLAGGLDELGAVADTLGGTGGRENIWNSDRRLADIWANNQRQNSAILSYDQEAHPYASTAAEVGGSILGGFVIPYGQGARTIPQLAKVGGVFGGATGFLGTDGTVADRSLGAVKGTLAGALVTPALGKAVEAVAPAVLAGGRRLLGRGASETSGRVGAGSISDPAIEAPAAPGADDWSAFPVDEGDAQVDALLRSGAGAATVNSVLKQQGREPIPLHKFAARKAMAMESAPDESLSMAAPRDRDYLDLGPERPRPLLDPVNDAHRLTAAERVQPRDVLPVPGNMVADAEEAAAIEAGRYAPAKALDERDQLDRLTVPGINGPVPKVGPVDMVGWLRLAGGLRPDDGGELAFMGITNAPRRGLEHVGQENRFGQLVHDSGMDLDDAALRAWEAGYFPEHSQRPTINEFLEGLRDTYEGNHARRFRSEDQPQLEAFDAARKERWDLEQQQADGPVSVDRSLPAEGEQPFAPPEAYDDASREAIRRVGNIDVSKLDSPQDIARALKTSHNAMGGFDAATRGRIAHTETERLAADLGMTADKLLSRRKGEAFNAEEALAARQILAKSGNELVNAARAISKRDDPGEDMLAEFRRKWMRHVAIQEQVSGMTAEAGRALQQFRQVADSRAVRTDVLNSIVLGGGGKKRLQDAADALLDMVETEPGKFNQLADKLAKPKWRDKIAEWYVNALLGWPQTHVVNVTSNTLTSLAQIPEFATGPLLGGLRQAISRQPVDRVTASEVGARAFGLLQGAKEGARLFAQALRTGEPSDFASKVEGQQFKAIGGKLGEVIRLPTRFLTAEDELFKGVARRMELNAQAVRLARKEGLRGEEAKARIANLAADPTDEMFQQALEYGQYLTFQQKLGPFAQKVSSIASENLPLKFLLPFVRTPTNLMKFATERSPAAPLLAEWRKDFLAGGEKRDMAVAKMMVGTGFGLAMYQAAANGQITGSAPSDPRRTRLLYADGWKPYSIKIGDTFYSYKRLDPFSTTIGVAADMATLPEGMTEKQREDKATLLVASIMGNLASKTWLSGASSFIEAITEPERYAGDFKNRLIASFLIPNVVGGTARSLDPSARTVETFSDEVQSRIPGRRDDLLPKRDIWGRPIVSGGGLGPDAISPIWISQQLDDPVNHELMQLDYAPSVPSKKIGGRELGPAEYDRYLELAGKGSHAALSALVTSPAWRTMDDEAKVRAARRTVEKAREQARADLLGGSNDAWAAFPAAKDAADTPDPWKDFPIADKRDVVADLRKLIPGIDFRSGYRDPAYNASLRDRGYHPSSTSEHLDGAALDMLPPPGKSLAWLRAQVKQYDPKARLLVHDGHLHAGFDGYNSAPKLGGMVGR